MAPRTAFETTFCIFPDYTYFRHMFEISIVISAPNGLTGISKVFKAFQTRNTLGPTNTCTYNL